MNASLRAPTQMTSPMAVIEKPVTIIIAIMNARTPHPTSVSRSVVNSSEMLQARLVKTVMPIADRQKASLTRRRCAICIPRKASPHSIGASRIPKV